MKVPLAKCWHQASSECFECLIKKWSPEWHRLCRMSDRTANSLYSVTTFKSVTVLFYNVLMWILSRNIWPQNINTVSKSNLDMILCCNYITLTQTLIFYHVFPSKSDITVCISLIKLLQCVCFNGFCIQYVFFLWM